MEAFPQAVKEVPRRIRQRNLLTAGALVAFVGGVYLYTSQKMKATVRGGVGGGGGR
jgi:hypothetical protein